MASFGSIDKGERDKAQYRKPASREVWQKPVYKGLSCLDLSLRGCLTVWNKAPSLGIGIGTHENIELTWGHPHKIGLNGTS